MNILDVAFVWNQHQPFYRDASAGSFIMPWLRLHAAKDYYQMASILERYPTIRQTFNLTPSLLEQLEEYLAGAQDQYLMVARPVAQLTTADKRFLLHHYFDIQWDRVIATCPRYRELLQLQGQTREPEQVERALERFSLQDYRDLQVWFNLAWIDPETRRTDPDLSALEKKGRDFSETDRAVVLQAHMDIMRRIVPIHRKLQRQGVIEMITTPFYHPIVPLLIDNYSALRASPGLPLPRRFSFPKDADAQMQMAVNQYRRLFGNQPKGVWPPEQAVSPETIPLYSAYGIKWTISDEQILAHSLNEEIHRDGYGHVLNGDLLYRPYRVAWGGAEMAIVFRDHHLSDRIGFEYQHYRPEDAAADLVHRLCKIRENLSLSKGPHLVTIALDGENAWEWYQGDKGPFLNSLYRRLVEERNLRCVTVSEHLAAHPPQRSLNHLFSGSWVDHCFTRWIGTLNKNALWDLLLEAREAVERYANGSPDPDKLDQALRMIYVAEGSDYSWWIDSMPYYLAAPFDALFRKHLVALYMIIGADPPENLKYPLAFPSPGESAFSTDPLSGPIPMLQQKK